MCLRPIMSCCDENIRDDEATRRVSTAPFTTARRYLRPVARHLQPRRVAYGRLADIYGSDAFVRAAARLSTPTRVRVLSPPRHSHARRVVDNREHAVHAGRASSTNVAKYS